MDEIAWTRRALRNLNDIGDYIARNDQTAAHGVTDRITRQVSRLASYPRIGRAGSVEGTRELVVSGVPYIVIYRIKERIEILRIRHAAQRWPQGSVRTCNDVLVEHRLSNPPGSRPPEGRAEQDQDGEQFEAAEEHGAGQQPFGAFGQTVKTTGRADHLAQPRTDIGQ